MKPSVFVFGLLLLAVARPSGQEQSRDNYYGAANRIDIRTPIDGDAVVAGRVVNIDEEVRGDVLAAGWRVALTHRALDDVRVAGSEVTINAPVDGDLTVAGGDVTVGRNTHVAGRAWLTGGTVRIDGMLERDTQIAGGTVVIGGEIHQPLKVTARKLEILPNAHVLGTITYSGPVEAVIAKEAHVTGPVVFHRIAEAEANRARWAPALSSTLFAVHLTVAGLLLLFGLPEFASAGVNTLRANPWRSLAAGFMLIVSIPAAVLLLVVTIVGAPVGLTVLALFLIALLVGILTTAAYVGQLEARWLNVTSLSTRSQNALAFIAGTLTLAVLRSVFGGVIVLVSVVFGFGAIALLVYRSRLRLSSTAL